MILQEYIQNGGRTFIKTVSDAGFMIRQDQTGILYAEAVDDLTTGYTYVETDVPIVQEEPDVEDDRHKPRRENKHGVRR